MAIAWASGTTGYGSGTPSSVSATGITLVSGDTLVAWVMTSGTSAVTYSLNNPPGSTWVAGTRQSNSGNSTVIQVFYAVNVSSGSYTLTVTPTWNFGNGDIAIICDQYSGIAASSALDVEGGYASGPGHISTTAAFSTAGAGELVSVGVMWFWTDNTNTPDTNFTLRENLVSGARVVEDNVNAAQFTSGTVSMTGIHDVGYATAMIALKPAASGGGGALAPRPLLIGQGINRASTF